MIKDFAIFGAGIIGTSIFNELTRNGASCVLIEIGNDVAMGATKANSGLVHAGFDAKLNTLKSFHNVRGNEMYDEMCSRLHVSFKRIGALVVGDDKDTIEGLFNRGIENGVKALEILNFEQIKQLVPNINAQNSCALYAKNAGIVSPYELCIALAEEAVINGGEVEFDFDTKCAKYIDNHYEIENINNKKIYAKNLIVAVGSEHNNLAKKLNIETYKIDYRLGEYCLLDSNSYGLVNKTIFPMPTSKGKGILITPTIDGNILVGPTSEIVESNEPITTNDGINQIKLKSLEILTDIPFNQNIRVFAGVRTIVGDDFVIEDSKKMPNVTILTGICSPGLSSAPSIAKYISEKLGYTKLKKSLKQRKPYTDITKLSLKQIDNLIKQNSDYGEIICKCEKVTKGEILEALNSPLKPNSVDAVKRRVRAGMGRCQGTFCFDKVIKIIAENTNKNEMTINKENLNSNFYVSNIKEDI